MITSTPCFLKIVPLHNVLQYGELNGQAHVVTVDEPYIPALAPGSFRVSDVPSKGIYQKKHSFRIRNCSADEQNRLMAYSEMPCIAFYTDETGHQRVSGSPDFPLSFSFQQSDGGYACSLDGNSLSPDPYLCE